MESYIGFLSRTNSFEKERLELGDQRFVPKDSLSLKVKEDNTFKRFYGDTVVFSLPEEAIQKASKLLDILYQESPECFAKRLPDESLHMTLHDLVSSESLDTIEATMREHEKVMEVIKRCNMLPDKLIHMKTNYVINMVHTSLVLAAQPCSKIDFQRLMKFYHVFEEVVKLPYPFTPHITLAYYNVNGFDGASAQKLSRVVTKLNQDATKGFEFYIATKDLIYQTFTSMEDYTNVVYLRK